MFLQIEGEQTEIGRGRKQTHEGRETLDVDLFCYNEATAALLAGRLSDHGDGVLGWLVGTEASGCARGGGIAVIEACGETVLGRLGKTDLIGGGI